MILITGAKGFLGNSLAKHFVEAGLTVLPMYHSSELKIYDDHWEADLSDINHIHKLCEVDQTPDTVIHLAGRVEISLKKNPLSPLMPPIPGNENIYSIYSNNVITTANILDYCLLKGVNHIIYASTQAVYGIPINDKLTEESSCSPLEHYAMSKLNGELLLQIGAKQGINVTVLRFPGLYSENRTKGLVYQYCLSAIEKKRIQVEIDIPLPLDVIHVDDVNHAFEKTFNYGGKNWTCLNIATGEPCNVNMLADSIAEIVQECEVLYSVVEQPVVCMDSTKAYDLLGWKPMLRRDRLLNMINIISKRL